MCIDMQRHASPRRTATPPRVGATPPRPASARPAASPAQPAPRRRRRRPDALLDWGERSVTTELGKAIGIPHSSREHERLYRATLQAVANGLVLGRGRHGVVVALSNDPADPRFKLAAKLVHKQFTPSRGREPSFHRSVAHSLEGRRGARSAGP